MFRMGRDAGCGQVGDGVGWRWVCSAWMVGWEGGNGGEVVGCWLVVDVWFGGGRGGVGLCGGMDVGCWG